MPAPKKKSKQQTWAEKRSNAWTRLIETRQSFVSAQENEQRVVNQHIIDDDVSFRDCKGAWRRLELAFRRYKQAWADFRHAASLEKMYASRQECGKLGD